MAHAKDRERRRQVERLEADLRALAKAEKKPRRPKKNAKRAPKKGEDSAKAKRGLTSQKARGRQERAQGTGAQSEQGAEKAGHCKVP